ncbi:hypothetical protein H1230_15220 [Paenibacillus sp. 19GGS1-52]|uniref:hypothetical protein n=1 Tax=Paenibacillus sp. 19GGS1-52 TaxID=2758563 RepID=UPI001EFBF088|nr:hypothetical protein [Paenibacillus sp. 19GGS1-52]ULO09997.1 hypothetical protein H1230_15220 [Paenibacillus sp. 19GGS1-52]
MSNTYKVLSTDADLFTAALAQVQVYVVQKKTEQPDCIVDYCGPIREYTPDFVNMGDIKYRRAGFEFRVHIPKKAF